MRRCNSFLVFVLFLLLLMFAKQIVRDLVLSCIVIEQFNPSMHVEILLDEIWKSVNLVSYKVSKEEVPG